MTDTMTETMTVSDGVTVTERAARRIGEILKNEPEGTMLRVSVEGGGCSGFQYKFDMDRDRAADDIADRARGRRSLDRSGLTRLFERF